MPGAVITRLVPSVDIATNNLSSGDHAIALHALASAAVLAVHVMPSGEVITFPPVDTAQNNDNSGDHVISFHVVASLADLAVKFPRVRVMVAPYNSILPEARIIQDQ